MEDQTTDDQTEEASEEFTEEGAADDSMRRKRDIVDHVSNKTGLKKRDVREALDACFGYIHGQLKDGKDVAYPNFGKLRQHVQRADSENPKTIIRVALAKSVETESEEVVEAVEAAE